MMSQLHFPAVCSCLVLALAAAEVHAQAAASDTPPKLEKLDEGEMPSVTIRPAPDKSTVTEKRAPGGKRTEARVKSGNSSYIVKANDQAGSTLVGDGQSIGLRPAQWEVLSFDLNKSRTEQQQEVAEAPEPPAVKTAPAAPAKKK